jgi:hypothetical protein
LGGKFEEKVRQHNPKATAVVIMIQGNDTRCSEEETMRGCGERALELRESWVESVAAAIRYKTIRFAHGSEA